MFFRTNRFYKRLAHTTWRFSRWATKQSRTALVLETEDDFVNCPECAEGWRVAASDTEFSCLYCGYTLPIERNIVMAEEAHVLA